MSLTFAAGDLSIHRIVEKSYGVRRQMRNWRGEEILFAEWKAFLRTD
jgi:hypothetical protein